MIKRGPSTRRRLIGLVPEQWEELVTPMRENPEPWAQKFGMKPTEFLNELADLEKERAATPLPMRHDVVRRQWTTPEMVQLIAEMTWTVFNMRRHECFMTSDNPVYFDMARGLQDSRIELNFPLTPNSALHCSWQGPKHGLRFTAGRSAFLKEVNRLTVAAADRFVFCQRKEHWLPEVAKKVVAETPRGQE